MEYIKLDNRAVKSWRIARGIVFGIVLITYITLLVLGQVINFPSFVNWIIAGVGATLLMVLLVSIFAFSKLEYMQWKYFISKDRVEIIHGIFFVKRVIIPVIRIQNIKISQGPVNRSLGLCNIEIFIASGSFEIPCLNKEVADSISENLKNGIYSRLNKKGN